MQLNYSDPWWKTDVYNTRDEPKALEEVSGPHGIATVEVFASGKTQPGWGLAAKKGPAFMENYLNDKFAPQPASSPNFAYVMRSMQLVCIDIDGKNDGFEGVKMLGMLPPTLAETSKSGNGFHLFYLAPDTWDEEKGFNSYRDRLGIVQGVDVRATGCVFHYPTQLWNQRELAILPVNLLGALSAQTSFEENKRHIKQAVLEGDEDTLLLLRQDIIDRLERPILEGKRNITLYALGKSLVDLEVEDWEDRITERARQLNLDWEESTKLVDNIRG